MKKMKIIRIFFVEFFLLAFAICNPVPKNEVPKNEVPKNEVPKNEVPKNEVLKNEEPKNFTIPNGIKCNACKFAAGIVQQTVETDSVTNLIAFFAADVCELLLIEDAVVCQGIIAEFKDQIIYLVAHTALSPECICSKLISDCGHCTNNSEPWNITFPNVDKPSPEILQLPPPDAEKLRIVHISDIHFDKRYTIGSETKCAEPLCCRFNGTHDNGANGPVHVPAGRWGMLAQCDTPKWTVELLLKHLNQTANEFDFIYLTGDLPAHNDWQQTRADQLEVLKTITDLFKTYLPQKRVFSTFGNHESAPVNMYPPHYKDLPEEFSIDWLYFAAAENWADWINDSRSVATVRQIGSYVANVMPGLRIISLNTNYCPDENYWLNIDAKNPDGVLDWLIAELQDAENHGDKVHILGHIPNDSCLKWWSWNYYKIIERYENTIRGQFFGHTHGDHYTMFYENADFNARPISVQMMAPSVTTYQNKNPGFKIFTIDGPREGTTWAPLKHETYYLDIKKANALPEGTEPVWELEYDTKIAFNMSGGFPMHYQELFENLKNGIYLNDYVRYENVLPNTNSDCDANCKRDTLCDIRQGRSDDPNLCSDLNVVTNTTTSTSTTTTATYTSTNAPTSTSTTTATTTITTSTNTNSITSKSTNVVTSTSTTVATTTSTNTNSITSKSTNTVTSTSTTTTTSTNTTAAASASTNTTKVSTSTTTTSSTSTNALTSTSTTTTTTTNTITTTTATAINITAAASVSTTTAEVSTSANAITATSTNTYTTATTSNTTTTSLEPTSSPLSSNPGGPSTNSTDYNTTSVATSLTNNFSFTSGASISSTKSRSTVIKTLPTTSASAKFVKFDSILIAFFVFINLIALVHQ